MLRQLTLPAVGAATYDRFAPQSGGHSLIGLIADLHLAQTAKFGAKTHESRTELSITRQSETITYEWLGDS
jgi:hypothetical protein